MKLLALVLLVVVLSACTAAVVVDVPETDDASRDQKGFYEDSSVVQEGPSQPDVVEDEKSSENVDS